MPDRRANSLDGRTWTRYSISVWDDIRKSKEELRLKHPALFPVALPLRLLECFLPPQGKLVVDPFCGLGSTVLAAQQLDRQGLGFDTNPDYVDIARARLREQQQGRQKEGDAPPSGRSCSLLPPPSSLILHADAASLLDHVPPGTVDMVITSPPYWDVLTRRRSADRKEIQHYGEEQGDLGRLADYQEFLTALGDRFSIVHQALRPGAYCAVVVMDLRKQSTFYPFHSDVSAELQRRGFLLDDIIIWDRRQEYNHFRPLGYPTVFRINKAHEFLLIFQKPRERTTETQRPRRERQRERPTRHPECPQSGHEGSW